MIRLFLRHEITSTSTQVTRSYALMFSYMLFCIASSYIACIFLKINTASSTAMEGKAWYNISDVNVCLREGSPSPAQLREHLLCALAFCPEQ